MTLLHVCQSSLYVHRSPSQHSSQRIPQRALNLIRFNIQLQNQMNDTGLGSTVGNVSDCRCLLTAKSSAVSLSLVLSNTFVEILIMN